MVKTIILSDAQEITKAGILYLLNTVRETYTAYEADNKKELLAQLTSKDVDLVVLDYTAFDFTGPEDLMNLSYRFSHLHWVLISDELSTDFLRMVTSNSEQFSVVFKDASNEEIRTSLTMALKRERYLCNRAVKQLMGKPVQIAENRDLKLTQTESDILRLIALGKTNKEIAQERFSSIHTIMTHRKNIFRKINVNSVHEATRYALRAGIIDSVDYYI